MPVRRKKAADLARPTASAEQLASAAPETDYSARYHEAPADPRPEEVAAPAHHAVHHVAYHRSVRSSKATKSSKSGKASKSHSKAASRKPAKRTRPKPAATKPTRPKPAAQKLKPRTPTPKAAAKASAPQNDAQSPGPQSQQQQQKEAPPLRFRQRGNHKGPAICRAFCVVGG